MFEKVEENVLLAVSLGQKLKGIPRLLADFLDNYVGMKDNAAPRSLVQGITPRRWKVGVLYFNCNLARLNSANSLFSELSVNEPHDVGFL